MHDVDEAWKQQVCEIVLRDEQRRACLGAVAALGIESAWIGAGFVRNAVFDALFGQSPPFDQADIDVVYIDTTQLEAETDRALERELTRNVPVRWQVKNQARMALRYGHAPYASIAEAISYFPEVATAVALRSVEGTLELAAPYGLGDLMTGIIRPTPSHRGGATYASRCQSKRWRERWPALRVLE